MKPGIYIVDKEGTLVKVKKETNRCHGCHYDGERSCSLYDVVEGYNFSCDDNEGCTLVKAKDFKTDRELKLEKALQEICKLETEIDDYASIGRISTIIAGEILK